MNCSPPGFSDHGILQARILEWVAIPFSRGSSQSRYQTQVSCIAGRFFNIWATREAQWGENSRAQSKRQKPREMPKTSVHGTRISWYEPDTVKDLPSSPPNLHNRYPEVCIINIIPIIAQVPGALWWLPRLCQCKEKDSCDSDQDHDRITQNSAARSRNSTQTSLRG